LWLHGIFFHVLVYCVKENLATLISTEINALRCRYFKDTLAWRGGASAVNSCPEHSFFLSETGIQTKRYARGGKFIHRDFEKFGPAIDDNGKYRPQRPTVNIGDFCVVQNYGFCRHQNYRSKNASIQIEIKPEGSFLKFLKSSSLQEKFTSNVGMYICVVVG
jgi:hypothetical protein